MWCVTYTNCSNATDHTCWHILVHWVWLDCCFLQSMNLKIYIINDLCKFDQNISCGTFLIHDNFFICLFCVQSNIIESVLYNGWCVTCYFICTEVRWCGKIRLDLDTEWVYQFHHHRGKLEYLNEERKYGLHKLWLTLSA